MHARMLNRTKLLEIKREGETREATYCKDVHEEMSNTFNENNNNNNRVNNYNPKIHHWNDLSPNCQSRGRVLNVPRAALGISL